MITGVWINEGGTGTMVATQHDDGDEIVVTDYQYDPPLTSSVSELDGDVWHEFVPAVRPRR